MDVSLVEWLVNASVACVVVVLILTGALVPGWVHKKEEAAREKAEDALAIERARNAAMEPFVTAGAKAIVAMAEVVQEKAIPPAAPRVPTPPEGMVVA